MRSLVVGVDGEAPSFHALDWAVDAVGVDGEIHVVTAVDTAWSDRTGAEADPLASRLSEIRNRVATISTSIVEGSAAEALQTSGGWLEADAIVVGAHVPPRAMPKRIGRTIHDLLEHPGRPVIVVPTEAVVGRTGDDPVIVGVGRGEATQAAVCWAARWADNQGVALGLVRATGERPTFGLSGLLELVAYYIDPSQRLTWTHEDLAEFAAAAQAAAERELDIATTAVGGGAPSALVDQSVGASLLVIGRHDSAVFGEGHTARLLQHALTHAVCPVAVVPPEPYPPPAR